MTQYETKYAFTNGKPGKNFDLFTLVIYAALIMVAIGIWGCGTSKKTTNTDSAETKTILKTDTLYKLKTDTVRVTKTETKVETKTEVKFDTIQKDCPKNKIIYKNNGDVEIEGNIREYNHQISNWKNKYDSMAAEYEIERGNRMYFQDESKKVKTITITKKSSWLIPFLWGGLAASLLWIALIIFVNRKRIFNK